MAITQVVIPQNLGTTIKPNHLVANKYDVQIDNDTLTANGTGLISVNTTSSTLDAMVKAFETTTSISYNPATKSITYNNEDGISTVLDLSALALDIFVSGSTYNAGTMILTLTDTNPNTAPITINLADLKQVAYTDSATVDFSGTGETASPLTASVKIDPAPTNLINSSANGIQVLPTGVTNLATVELVDAFSNIHIGYIFP
jgi:hypothetical protein